MSTSVTTVQELSEAIAAATVGIDEQGRRLAIAVYDLLAQGDPLSPAEIAAHAREPEAVVLATLKGWPGVSGTMRVASLVSGASRSRRWITASRQRVPS